MLTSLRTVAAATSSSAAAFSSRRIVVCTTATRSIANTPRFRHGVVSSVAETAGSRRPSSTRGLGRCCVRLCSSNKTTSTTTTKTSSPSLSSSSSAVMNDASTKNNNNTKTNSRSRTTFASRQQQRQQQQQQGQFNPVYVHHVSRVALEHLQSSPQCKFLIEKGLDSRLNIHPNGTFTLTFPPLDEHRHEDDADRSKSSASSATANSSSDGGKIWTSYDPPRKQHWLSVYRHKLAVRFLLKDHNTNEHQAGRSAQLPSSSSEVHSAQYRDGIQQIRSAVDEMIKAVKSVDFEKLSETVKKNQQRQALEQQSHILLKKLRGL